MRSVFVLGTLCGVLWSSLLIAAGDKEKSAAAIVNGKVIDRDTISKVLTKQKGLDTPDARKKFFDIARESQVGMTLFLQEARKMKLNEDKRFKEAMEAAEEKMLLRFFIEELEKKVREKISKKDMEDQVEKLKGSDNQIKFEQMVVRKDRADGVKKALAAGQSFKKMIDDYSVKDQKFKAPALQGPFLEKDLAQELGPELKDKRVNDVIVIPIPSSENALLIRIAERTALSDPKLLGTLAARELQKKTFKDIIDEMMKKADIKRFDIDGNPVKAPDDNEQNKAK